ncbi:MAG: leukotoxin LktA family filamentous adhesin [Opitutales bacterium]
MHTGLDFLRRQYVQVLQRCRWLNAVFAFSTTVLALPVQAQSIVADGRTATTVASQGAVTDVRTESVRGINAYNSFSRFNVEAAQTVNLHLPGGTRNLVNVVHQEATSIDGILNSYRDGSIGGNVFFLNPHGIVVGESGVLNVGSLALVTPTQEFAEQLIRQGGLIDDALTRQVLDGQVPLTPTGLISIRGTIQASGSVRVEGGSVDVARGGVVHTGVVHDAPVAVVQASFGDLVNVQGLQTASAAVVQTDGTISLRSLGNVDVAGSLVASGASAPISIDSSTIELTGAGDDQFSSGSDIELFASESITLTDVVLSTRQVAGSGRTAHRNGASTGDSGNLSLTAPQINVIASELLAQGTGGFAGGDVTLLARTEQNLPFLGSFDTAHSTIDVRNSTIQGENVRVEAIADDVFEWDETAIDTIFGVAGFAGLPTDFFADVTFSSATADVIVQGTSVIDAAGTLDVLSTAQTEASMRVLSLLAGVGYGEADSQSRVLISGANLTSGGNMTLGSTADANVSVEVSTVSTGLTNPLLGSASQYAELTLALGVGKIDAETTVTNGSSINSGGTLEVNALGLKENNVTGDSSNFDDGTAAVSIALSFFDTEVTAELGGNVTANAINLSSELLSENNGLSTRAGAGAPGVVDTFRRLSEPDQLLVETLSGWVLDPAQSSVDSRASNSKLGLSAGFIYADHANIVDARIGDNARIISNNALRIAAEASDQLNYYAGAKVNAGTLNGQPNKKETALSSSIAIVNLKNEVTAEIGENARVNSSGLIDVYALAKVPSPLDRFRDWESIEDFEDFGNRIGDILGSPTFSLLTGWVQNEAQSEKFALSGAFNTLNIENTAEARIATGAILNDQLAPIGESQDVSVRALAQADVINLSGIFGFTNPLGLSSDTGFGGSYVNTGIRGGASAIIETGATVAANNLYLDAFTNHDYVGIAQAGGNGGRFTIIGSVAISRIDNTTLAQIQGGAQVDVQDAWIRSRDTADVVAIAGGIVRSSGAGIGVSAAVNEIERDTRAVMGNAQGESFTGGSFDAAGNLRMEAHSDGFLVSASLAAAMQAPKNPSDTGGQGKQSASSKGSGGFGLSADISINTVRSTAMARVADGFNVTQRGDSALGSLFAIDLDGDLLQDITTTLEPGIALAAADSTWSFAFGGAITLATGKNSTGLAGAYGDNDFVKITEASIGDSLVTITNGGALNLSAENSGRMWAVTVSGSGGGRAGAAGSFSINGINNETTAALDGTEVTGAGDVTLSAEDLSEIRSVAGAVAGGGKAGFGASVGINKIANQTEARLIDAQLTDVSTVMVDALNDNFILGFSAGGAFGGGLTVSGSLAVNTIDNRTEAKLENSTVENAGAVRAQARDISDMDATTGAVSGASGNAFGLSGSYNEITSQTRARMSGGSVLEATGLSLSALRDNRIDAIAIGASIGGGSAGGGSIVINDLNGTTEAILEDDAQVSVTGNVAVLADSVGTINAFAGGVGGGGGSAGVGAGIATNLIGDTTRAQILGAGTLVDSRGLEPSLSAFDGTLSEADDSVAARRETEALRGVAVIASSVADSESLALSIGGSSGVGVAGSLVIDILSGSTEAQVVDAAVRSPALTFGTASGLRVGAYSHTGLAADTGNAAIAGSNAAGGAIHTAFIDNTTEALVENATVDLRGAIGVNARSTQEIETRQIGAAAGGAPSLQASIGATKVTNATSALVRDSDLDSEEDIEIAADSLTDIEHFGGGFAGSLSIGVGATAGILLVDDSVLAATEGATSIDTPATTSIRAERTLNVDSTKVTGALAAGTGIAGSLGVNILEGQISARVSGDTEINQNASGAAQDVEVLATNNLTGTSFAGAASFALSGAIGAGIDINLVRTSTLVEVESGARIDAERDLTLQAQSTRDVTSRGAALAVDPLTAGVSGGVSVVHLGGTLNETASDETASTTQFFDDILSDSLVADQLDTGEDSATGARDTVNQRSGDLDLQDNVDAVVPDNNFTVAVRVGAGAELESGRDLNATAGSASKIVAEGDAAGVGLAAGIGGGVAVLTHDDAIDVSVGGMLLAGRDLTLQAQDIQMEASLAETVAGGGGIVGLGASVARANQHSSVDVNLLGGSSLTALGNIDVGAALEHKIKADALGGSLGLGAIGVASGRAQADGTARVDVGAGVTLQGGDVRVDATVVTDVESDAQAVSAGILAGNGSEAFSTDETSAVVTLGEGSQVTGTGEVVILAQVQPEVDAEATGVIPIAGAGIGASVADADTTATATLTSAENVQISGGDVTLSANVAGIEDRQSTRARAAASAGGLSLAVTGAEARADFNPTSLLELGGANLLNATGGLNLLSEISGSSWANGTSRAFGGILGIGGTGAYANVHSDARAILGEGLVGNAGGLLRIAATTDTRLYSETVAGSGSLTAGVAAAITRTNNEADARVQFGRNGDAADVLLSSDEANVLAQNSATFDGRTDSTAAGLVGGSGADMRHRSNANAVVESRRVPLSLTSQGDLTVAALNHVENLAVDEAEVTAGSGGAVAGAAALSRTDFENFATILLGTNTTLVTLDEGSELAITARNNVRADEQVSLDAGGAITGTGVETLLRALTNEALVDVFGGSRIESAGNLTVTARALIDLNAEARAKTYGLASGMGGTTLADAAMENTVRIRSGAVLTAFEDLRLAAGEDDIFSANVSLFADTRLWNRSVVPISVDDAVSRIDQTNTLEIQTGAIAEAVQDIELVSAPGSVFVSAFALDKSIYDEAADAVDDFFRGILGGEPSLDQFGGERIESSDSGIVADGIVRSGIQNFQFLHITTVEDPNNPGQNVIQTETSDGVSFTISDPQPIANLLAERIIFLRERAAEYDGLDVALAFESEANFLQGQLDELQGRDPEVPFVEIDPIVASPGNVFITGDYLIGGGELRAPGDAVIEVTNDTPLFLEFSSLFIPDQSGGRVTFNEAPVSSAADINARNGQGRTTAVTVVDATGSPEPRITILNTYQGENTPGDVNGQGAVFLLPSEVILNGDTENRRGPVDINSRGSIRVLGNIDAATIRLASDGDFVKSFTFGFDHQAGNPEEIFQNLQDESEAGRRNRTLTRSQVEARGDLGNKGSRIFGGSIFISADKLNVNGLIQSGFADQSLFIGASEQAQINSFEQTYNLQRVFNPGISPLFRIDTGPAGTGDGNLPLFYNAELDRLEVDSSAALGGYIELFGDIFSTGGGQLVALDGFSQFSIDNQTALPLFVRGLDSGTGVEGVIRITDTARRVFDGQVFDINALPGGVDRGDTVPLTTQYARIGGQVQVTDSRELDANGLPMFDTGGNGAVYQPLDGRRYVWVTGQNFSTRRTQVRANRSRTFFGANLGVIGDWLATDPDTVTTSTTVALDREPLLEGSALIFEGGSAFYTYQFSSQATQAERQVGQPIYRDRCVDTDSFLGISWCAEREYSETTIFDSGRKDFHRHTLQADIPIEIAFLGNETGGIDITSIGDVYIGGVLRAGDGTASVRSTGGSVLDANGAGRVLASSVRLDGLGGSVGTSTEAIDIDTSATGSFSASARDFLAVNEITGDLRLGTVNVSQGQANLFADGSVVNATPGTGAVITAEGLNLQARNGSIGGSEFLRVHSTGEAGVSARAATDIRILETTDDLHVDRIQSGSGDVFLTTLNGDLIDANPDEVRDPKTEAELLGLWEDNRLIGEFAEESRRDTVADIYERYWREARNLRFDENGDPIPSISDPNVVFNFTATERAALLNQGLSLEEIGERELELTGAWREIARNPYSTTFETDGTLATLATSEAFAGISDGYLWQQSDLETSISAALIQGTSDTDARIEDPNIIGRNVTIVANGQVGSTRGDLFIERGPEPRELTEEIKLALSSAERDDIEVTDDFVRIAQREDVDIDVDVDNGGTLSVTALNQIFVGSEEDINIERASTVSDVRFKVEGGIFAAPIAPGTSHITANALVLEAANGFIGTVDNPLHVSLGGTLTARALQDIHLRQLGGDLAIDFVFSGRDVFLDVEGSVLDAFDDDQNNVEAREVVITNVDSVGTATNALEIALNSAFSATVSGGVFLQSLGDLQVGLINADADVELLSTSSIENAGRGAQVRSTNGTLALTALDGIGNNGALEVFATEVNFRVVGTGDVNLFNRATGATLVGSTANGGIAYGQQGNLDVMQVSANGGSAWLSAEGDLNVDLAHASETLFLIAQGDLNELSPSTNGFAALEGQKIWLVSTNGNIGTQSDPFLIDSQGTLDVFAAEDVILEEIVGELNVDRLISRDGALDVTANDGDLNIDYIFASTGMALESSGSASVSRFGSEETFSLPLGFTDANPQAFVAFSETVGGGTAGGTIALDAPGARLSIDSLTLSSELNIRADFIELGVNHAGEGEAMRLGLQGGAGRAAQSIVLDVDSEVPVVLTLLRAEDADVFFNAPSFGVEEGWAGEKAVFESPNTVMRVDTEDRTPRPINHRLFTLDNGYAFVLSGPELITENLVISYTLDRIINDAFSDENSLLLLRQKFFQLEENDVFNGKEMLVSGSQFDDLVINVRAILAAAQSQPEMPTFDTQFDQMLAGQWNLPGVLDETIPGVPAGPARSDQPEDDGASGAPTESSLPPDDVL